MKLISISFLLCLLAAGTGLAQSGPPHPGRPGPQAAPGGGPYYHQVYRAFSNDGFNFIKEGKLLLDHASVPDAVIRPDGQTWVYFVNGEPNKHGIWIARETKGGKWDTFDRVLLDGKFKGNVADPDILRLPDGRYRLYYFEGHFVESRAPGQDNPPPGRDVQHPFYSAISTDGIHFTVEQEVFSLANITDPSVVYLPSGTWLMAISRGPETLLAISKDGKRFTATGVKIEEGGVPELAVLPDGRIRLFVTGHGIRSLLSEDDGKTWKLESGVRVPADPDKIVADPSFIPLPDGRWALYYKEADLSRR